MIKCAIRKALIEDIPAVMDFIRNNWSSSHILCSSENFMRWQHLYNQEYCFYLAVSETSNEILGVVGYIPYSDEKQRDVFGALWKVTDNCYPGTGLMLKLALMRDKRTRSLTGIGLNPATLEMHRRSGGFVDSLKHYYIISERKQYNIASIKNRVHLDYDKGFEQYRLTNIIDRRRIKEVLMFEESIDKKPHKSWSFFERRYINHPIYKYRFLNIDGLNDSQGLFVVRDEGCFGERILRIIDYIGDPKLISHTGLAFKEIINADNYEYIDFYEYGIPDEILVRAGFVCNDKESGNIIPNYFSPFERKNIELNFYTDLVTPFYIFRGDGDQDRPSVI